jgi:hypothetical protein
LTSNKDSSRQGLFVCVGKLKFEGKIRSNWNYIFWFLYSSFNVGFFVDVCPDCFI